MKKKIFCLLMIVAIAFSLAACGGSNAPASGSSGSGSASSGSQQSSTASAAATEFSFETGGKTVRIDEDMEKVLADIGKEKSYFEAASCAFDGLDKTYTYSGFEIITRPEGDKDFVNCITLTDDSVTTREGLYIGCSRDEVIKIYGDGGEETLGGITYTLGNTVLSVILEKDTVVSIEYLAN